MLGRIKQTDLSVPSRIGDYFYYSRTEEGKQYPYMCRRKGSMEGTEELLLDLNALAEGHKFLGLGAYAASDDGNWLAYSTDTTGYRQYSLHVKDLRKGQVLAENIERVGSVVWATDNKTLFYTTEDAVSKRSDKFWRHAVGATASDLLYEEKSELFDVGAGRSLDKKVIFLGSYAKTSTEVRYLPADAPAGALKVDPAARGRPRVRRRSLQRALLHHHQQGREELQGRDRADERPVGEELEGLHRAQSGGEDQRPQFFANHIVVSEREGGLTQLRVIDPKTKQSHRIATDEPDFALSLGSNPEFDTTTVRFNYQSMVTPSSVYDYDLTTRQRKLLKRQEVLGGYDPSRYEARRIWAVARDGTKVPISVVHRKGIALDGKAPLLLYGYGSYGASGAPTFSSNRLSLLDRGVIFANAYIRGGGEMGEEWREQGRMMKKINTFNDFIDCAEYLVKNEIHGSRSAGDSGRERRRPAGRRRDEHAARPLQGGRGPGAVRRRHQHHARRVAAADDERVSGVGESQREAGVRLHDAVLAVRQHQGGELSGDARAGVAQRQPGAVLGRHEARRQAARDEDRQEPAAAEGQHGRGPRRLVRPLRRAARDGVHLRVHAVADGRAVAGGTTPSAGR